MQCVRPGQIPQRWCEKLSQVIADRIYLGDKRVAVSFRIRMNGNAERKIRTLVRPVT